MKIQTEEIELSTFKPITLTITIESEEELKVWYELGNYDVAVGKELERLLEGNGRKINIRISSLFSKLYVNLQKYIQR